MNANEYNIEYCYEAKFVPNAHQPTQANFSLLAIFSGVIILAAGVFF